MSRTPLRSSRWMVSVIVLLLVMVVQILTPDARAQVPCGGLQPDACPCGQVNTYPCCTNDGNCTWYAWYCACCFWNEAIPHWGNAKQWAPGASTNPNYNVRSSPALDTIACRSVGTWGHVAWVTAINGSNVTVDEQNCDYGPGGVQEATRNVSYYDQGYIERAGCECSGNDTKTDYDCNEYCGTRTQTCDGCNYGPWSDCVDGGPCIPGEEATETCPGGCGEHTRQCNGDCQWGIWSECPDPATCIDAAVDIDGTSPSDGAPSTDGTSAVDADDPTADSGNSSPHQETPGLRGGCDCRASGQQQTPVRHDVFWMVLLLLGLMLRFRQRQERD